jgi:translocation and assembly module TamB
VRLLKESSPAREKDFTTATESIPVDISKALAEVNWDEKGFVCSLQLELPKGGRINGKFSSPYGGKFVLPERGNLSGAWEGVDMSLLRPWTPPALGLDGTLQGKFDGEWLTDKRFTLKGEVKVAQGTAAWKEKNGVINVKLSTADLHMSWRDEVLAGDLRLTLENFGRVAGTFRLPLPARMPVKIEEREPVQFSLQGQAQELGMLSVLFPGSVEESRGELEMDLKGDGTWEKPRFEGRLSLTKAGAYLPGSGIHLEDVLLEAHSTADELRITSFRVHSGPGYLEGSGTISIKEGKLLRYEGNLRGERFETIHLPELEALANPRLDLEGTLEGLTVRGEIVIPELSLLGEQKKGVIRPSPDVVIVDAREDPEVSPALRLNGQVRVVLGDKVQVKAEGIDAQLTGSVMLNFRGSKEMIAHGEIRVSKGSYNAYGQKLEITRGRLLFDGPPDQPTLDVLALRKIRRPSRWEEQMNEIEAGVMVTGTLQSPLIRLYSRPSMPETDILSYIVLGVPISQGGNQNQMGVLVGAAGALLSAGEAALLQNQLLGGSGLDSLDIQISQPTEAGESTRSSQSKTGEITRSLITVGKYLNPQLFVGVGASLYNNTYQLILRYSLSKKIEIESRTGNQSGVSLFYKLWFK